MTELRTPRLILRQWRDDDLEPFAELNRDAETMRYFPAWLSREESDAFAASVKLALELRGWGLWAVEVVDGAPFIGFVGLNEVSFDAHFAPAVEVGWRLRRDQWGRGYAPEAAKAALEFGFVELGLTEIVAMTTPSNKRSRRVMERLGMTRKAADDFDHPKVPNGPLRRHVLYRISAP